METHFYLLLLPLIIEMNEPYSDTLHLLHNKPVYTRRKIGHIVYYIALLIAFISCTVFILSFIQESPFHESPVPYKHQLIKGNHAAVAVESEECSTTGVNILKHGGNAVDAAIASALCIGVINNFATGIGGGGFMLIRSPNGTYDFIDFRETAPGAATRDMFVKDPLLAQIGGLAVAVPGELRGFELAHQRHGQLPWSSLFEPAIALAEDGFKVSPLLVTRLKAEEAWMHGLKEWTDVYYSDGKTKEVGEVVRRPQLAETLRQVAENGADVFYTGKIGQSIVDAVQAHGGLLTMEDMRQYRAVVRPPVSTYYHGRKIVTTSSPTAGPVLLSIFNLIERFGFDGRDGLTLQRLMEAFKFGYAFRTEMGDPDFIHNPERMAEIIDKDYASLIRQNITDDRTHAPEYYGPHFDQVDNHGTMHLSVVDEEDGAVALTSTVNLAFGSHIMDPATGVILNNEMDDFSIPGTPNMFGIYPSKYNYIKPHKRPLSSITPVIVEVDSRFEMALGGSGGSLIPTATINTLINFMHFGQDLYTAIASARLHHQLMPNFVVAETGYRPDLLASLKEKGHEIMTLPVEYCISAVQAVRRLSDGDVEAASDPRKGGVAAAY